MVKPSKRVRLGVCALTLAASVGLLAGCGGKQDPEPTTPSNVPTEIPSGTTPSIGTPKPGKLPAGFPLPPGAKKGQVTQNAGTTAGQVTVKDGAKAYDFWTEQLPKKGYKISSKNKVDLGGSVKCLITFTGKGYKSATITINDTNATVSLQK